MPTSSLDKVENVVNPPKIPVMKNEFIQLMCSDNPDTVPINTHPIILTINVPTGNLVIN